MSNTEKVGVIVGRFQVPSLHEGHLWLIREVMSRHSKVVVVLGTSPAKGSATNPLDFATRAAMIEPLLEGKGKIVELRDQPDDFLWSSNLDASLRWNAGVTTSFVLYGSRDSFIPYYHGIYQTMELDEQSSTSGTEARDACAILPRDSEDFRAGIIYANANRYPVSYQTVDMAIFDKRLPLKFGEDARLLLGRRKSSDMWRFPGGFVDSWSETRDRGDLSLEGAAAREAFEETSLIIEDIRYVMSRRVDDYRYRRGKDKIMTALFTATATFPDRLRAADDLAEVRWFDAIPDLNLLVPEHRMLAHDLARYLKTLHMFRQF